MTDRSPDSRTDRRTSLFAAAILDAGASRFTVRIRNISPSGALIQGDALPPAGTSVMIVRGSLAASGSVRWSRDGRAGLAFTDAIRVEDWLSSCAPKTHQHGVDLIVAAIRTGVRPAASGAEMPKPGKTIPEPVSSTAGLVAIQQIIAGIAGRLAADPAVLERHSGDIQQLDAVASILESLWRRPPG
jgi:hypothetical protein